MLGRAVQMMSELMRTTWVVGSAEMRCKSSWDAQIQDQSQRLMMPREKNEPTAPDEMRVRSHRPHQRSVFAEYGSLNSGQQAASV